jgi:hypothetical protein
MDKLRKFSFLVSVLLTLSCSCVIEDPGWPGGRDYYVEKAAIVDIGKNLYITNYSGSCVIITNTLELYILPIIVGTNDFAFIEGGMNYFSYYIKSSPLLSLYNDNESKLLVNGDVTFNYFWIDQ